ncbi:sigma-70 family RNA polymerase sigma factor [Neisseria sp. ZJ106]|uniref:RNA polymerase sigma factor n=1 Tax=Neisseria lisongii TaxID=2912188 RepID=A0ABY7RI06_9NEIS|nr:sigma-70 family RNA polymerase sigma factor [Neisseria lisongii]MCF7520914.1 sigma-70 family RNA polymerase sigma factor [Neisseria lisongii]WCL71279.1 sigma-70 family RNA polymerase sigma factor [Neisseria lisongii]
MNFFNLDDAEFDRLRKLLLRFCRIQLPDRPDLAEDLVQDTMLSAYRACDQFKGEAQLSSWLFGILKNKIIDCLRSIGKQREVFVSPAEESMDEAFESHFSENGHWTASGRPDAWGSPDQSLNNKEFYQVLQACLYRLPENTARVFMMKEILGLSSAEVREQCSLSESNFHTTMHRAREGLRQCLQIKWFNQGEQYG